MTEQGGSVASGGGAETDDRTAGQRSDGETAGASLPAPEEAFSRLGNETRLRAIRTLAGADEAPTFTDLFEASDAETTAGFAYHLRQLTGHYVEKRETPPGDEADDRYHLTSAGRAVARALDAGVYTERVERGPDPVEGDCPVCGAASLTAGLADNFVSVACTGCETTLLTLPFPPVGARERDTAALLDAFDAYHRRRLSLVADGVCPECAGQATGAVEPAAPPAAAESDGAADDDLPGRPVVAAGCESCSYSVRAPVSVAVVDHPEVVAFFADHDAEPGPIWNLGDGWRETVLSTDPWAVAVSVRLGDGDAREALRLLVGDGPTVVDSERVAVDD